MKLNLGCGRQRLEGFVNVDLRGSDQDVDLSVFPWPWASSSISEILASHVLEHLEKDAAYRFIKECWRVLSPGGKLHIAVPDMDKFIDAHLSGDFSPLNGYHWTNLNHLCGGDETEKDPAQKHRYMYNFETLWFMCDDAPFQETIRREMLPIDNPDYQAISLYVTAYK